MAPKKNTKTPKATKAAPQVASEKKPPASAFDAFCEPKASEAVEQATNKTKSLRARVVGKLQYHFAYAPASMLYMRVSPKTGITLFERVMQDTAKSDSKTGDRDSMGKMYWQDRREEYESPADKAQYAKLQIQDESEANDEALKQALLALRRNNNKTDALIEWSEAVDTVNQKNFVVLLKCLWSIYPGQSVHLARLATTILKMIKRLDLHTTYEAIFAVMTDYFDLALEKLLASFATVQSGSSLWWDQVKFYADTVLDVVAYQTLYDSDPKLQFRDCGEVLKAVSAATRTGKLLCAKALVKLNQSELETTAIAIIRSLHTTDLTEVSIAASRKSFLTALATKGISTTMVPAPTTTPTYRGLKTDPVPVGSPLDLFNVHLEAFVRGAAVNMGLLDPQWFENHIVTDKRERLNSITPSLLASAKVGRKLATDFATEKTLAGLKAVFEKKGKFIIGKDPKFKVDAAFWASFLGENSSAQNLSAVIGTIRSDNKLYPESVTEAKSKMIALRDSLFSRICDEMVEAIMTTCIDTLTVLEGGSVPDWTKLVGIGSAEATIKHAFLGLVREKKSGTDVGVGVEMLVFKLEKLKEDCKKEPKPAYKDQTMLRQFMNFMTSEEATSCKALIDSLVVGGNGAPAATSSSMVPLSDGDGSAKKKRKRAHLRIDMDAIDDLFTNKSK